MNKLRIINNIHILYKIKKMKKMKKMKKIKKKNIYKKSFKKQIIN